MYCVACLRVKKRKAKHIKKSIYTVHPYDWRDVRSKYNKKNFCKRFKGQAQKMSGVCKQKKEIEKKEARKKNSKRKSRGWPKLATASRADRIEEKDEKKLAK